MKNPVLGLHPKYKRNFKIHRANRRNTASQNSSRSEKKTKQFDGDPGDPCSTPVPTTSHLLDILKQLKSSTQLLCLVEFLLVSSVQTVFICFYSSLQNRVLLSLAPRCYHSTHTKETAAISHCIGKKSWSKGYHTTLRQVATVLLSFPCLPFLFQRGHRVLGGDFFFF